MNLHRPILMLLISSFLFACAGAPRVSDEQLNSRYSNQTASQALEEAEAAFKTAKINKLDFFAKAKFAEASQALKQAREISKKDPISKDILIQTFIVEQQLKAADSVAKAIKEQLPEVLKLKVDLEKENTPKVYKSDYNSVLADIQDVFREVESFHELPKKTKEAQDSINKNKVSLLASMNKLHVRVVKFNSLDKSEKVLAQAESLNAEKLAPKTFKEANDALAAARKFIENNVYDKPGIDKVSEQFRFSVYHVLYVTQAVAELLKLDKSKFEDVVLQNEQRLLEISNALAAGDYRDNPVVKQVKKLVSDANQLKDSIEDKHKVMVNLSQDTLQWKKQVTSGNVASADTINQLNKEKAALRAELIVVEGQNKTLEAKVGELQQKVVEFALLNSELENEDVAATTSESDGFVEHDMQKTATLDSESTVAIDESPVVAGEEVNGDSANKAVVENTLDESSEAVQ